MIKHLSSEKDTKQNIRHFGMQVYGMQLIHEDIIVVLPSPLIKMFFFLLSSIKKNIRPTAKTAENYDFAAPLQKTFIIFIFIRFL